MHQSIKEHLESLFLSFQTIFSKSKKSTLETIEAKFKQLISEFNSEAITYCLEEYIRAELDYTTPGSRGLGRMTTNIPRFGAYFRKSLSKFSHQELNKLYSLIQDFCLRGYLAHVIFVEVPIRHAKLSDSTLLFEEWIPLIYGSDPTELGQNLKTWIDVYTTPAFKAVYDFMKQYKMKRSILFSGAGSFLSIGKVNEILSYHILAGFSLRAVEIREN